MSDCETLLLSIENNLEGTIKNYQKGGLSSLVIKNLYETEGDKENVQFFLSTYQDVPSKILESLVEKNITEKVQLAIAGHQRTPRQTLKLLAENGSLSVRKVIADNKFFSPQTASFLAKDDNEEVRQIVAANPATPLRILLELAKDVSASVRSSLFKQKKLDAEVFNYLLKDPSPLIRAYAASHADLTEEQLLIWADSDCFELQIPVLQRAQLSNQVLESLCFSPYEKIQIAAFKRRELMVDEMLHWLEEGSLNVKKYIAENMVLPEDLQLLIAKNSEYEVRQSLAINVNICEKAALYLFHDSDEKILTSLAVNCEMSEKALNAMALLALPKVNKILLTRKDLPQSVIQTIFNQGDEKIIYHLAYNNHMPQMIPKEIASRFVKHPLPVFRRFVARLTEDYHLQLKLIYDQAKDVREALSNNPNLDSSLRKILNENL